MIAAKQPLKCRLGFHSWIEIKSGNVVTYHAAFNPVRFKTFICNRCEKQKTIHYQIQSAI